MQTSAQKLAELRSRVKSKRKDLALQRKNSQIKKAYILKFIQDVYKIVSTKDDKQYVQGMMKLNQDYVMCQSEYTASN